MDFLHKARSWFHNHKKHIMIGGTVLSIAGATYVFSKHKKMSFSDWMNVASKEELEEVYEKMRIDFCKTGIRSQEMEQISHELGKRGAKEWFTKHPPNPNVRWSDANRWEKD